MQEAELTTKHWSRRFPKRKKLLQYHPAAAWAAWIINRQSKQQLTNSRARKGSAVLLSATTLHLTARGIILAE
jgi:hypothetical protein